MRVTLNFIILLFLMIAHQAMAQSVNPNDTLKLGKGSSSADKSLIFDTNNGVSNKKLSVESISKTLKYDGNKFQLGDGSASSNKEFSVNGTGKSLKYDGTASEFQLNDDLGITSGNKLKTNSIDAVSGSEVSVEQDIRAKGKVKIGTGSHELRVSGDKLEFTNNGTLYKKIGSGSGSGDGGISILENGSFEDGLTPGWSNTGGTLSLGNYGVPLEGEANYAQLVATSSGEYLESSAYSVSESMVGGCLAKVEFHSTDASGTWKLQVYDGSSNLLKEVSLDPKNWQAAHAPFSCPASGTIKLRVVSTAAGTIKVDKAYLGKENRTFQVAQAKIVGESHFPPTASCSWSSSQSVLSPFPATAVCPGPIIVHSSMGQWQTTDSDLPRQTINNLPAGAYKVSVTATVAHSASGDPVITLSDGTTSCPQTEAGNSAAGDAATISCVFSYAASGNRTFEIYGRSPAGSVNILNNVGSTKFSVEYFPSDSQTAVSPDSADGWMIAANIGNSTGINLGTTAFSTYTEITDATLDMVLQPSSAPAKIACASGNASTGLTCATGSESVGLTFTPPQAGLYKACFHFSNYVNTGSVAYNGFQIIETTDLSSAIVSEGGERILNGATGGVNTGHNSIRVCGIFNFTSATPKTLRLMREQTTGHSDNRISCDRAATYGQPDIYAEVYPLYNQQQRPILVDESSTVKSPGVTSPKVCSFYFGGTGATLAAPTVCATSPCVEVYDSCNAVSVAPTRSAAGTYGNVASFSSGTFAPNTPIVCQCEAWTTATGNSRSCDMYFNTGGTSWTTDSNGGTSLMGALAMGSSGIAGDSYFQIRCEGQASP